MCQTERYAQINGFNIYSYKRIHLHMQLALSLVVGDSFKLYKAISEGIINLADKFYDMDYINAMRAMEIYNEAIQGGNALKQYHSKIQTLPPVKREIQFPVLEIPPTSFIEAMEERIQELREASKDGKASDVKPLRKGKAVKLQFSVSDVGKAGVKSDPGMILAPLSRQTSEVNEAPKAPSAAADTEEEKVQETEMANDLLNFDDHQVKTAIESPKDLIAPEDGLDHEALDTTKTPANSQVTSDLDLLSELDFGSLHVSSESGPTKTGQNSESQTNSTQQTSWSNPIPDSFVVHAAGDLYGPNFASADTHKHITGSMPPAHSAVSNHPYGSNSTTQVPRKESTASTGAMEGPSQSGMTQTKPRSNNPFADL